MTSLDTAAQAALQDVLAGEHAACWTLALLGARTSQSTQVTLADSLRGAYAAHQRTRDSLISTIAGLGLTPVAAAPAYQSPPDIETVQGVTAAALAVEQAALRTYVSMAAATTGDLRATAIGLLSAAAIRELAFRGTPEAFPGAGELADR